MNCIKRRRIATKHIRLPHNNILYERPAAVKESRELTPREHKLATVMFGLAIVMYFIVNMQRVSVPGQIFDALQGELGISASKVAALGTAFMYIYAGTQLLAGLLVDKYGGMRVLTLGSILMAIGSFAFPLSNSYWMLVVCRVLVGFGCGATYLSLVKETDRLYPHKFAFMMGLIILLGYSGAVLGTMPFAIACKAFGWRTCLLVVASAVVATVLAIISLWRKVPKPAPRPEPLSLKPHAQGFTNVNNIIEILSFTTNYGIYFSILSVVGKKFLEDIGGLGTGLASLTCTLMVLVPALLNQVIGMLTTYTGNRRRPFFRVMNSFPLIGSTVISLAILCGDFPGRGVVFMAAFILISLVGGFTPITSSLARETNPPGTTGAAIGIINFGAYIMVALAGTVSGVVLDFFGGTPTGENNAMVYPQSAYQIIFLLFLVITVFTFKLSLAMPETYGKNICNGKKVKFLGITLHS